MNLDHPRNLTPGYPMLAMVVSGPMHGKLMPVQNPESNPYVWIRYAPPNYCMGFELPDKNDETKQFRYYEFIVGDRIRPMLIPASWCSLNRACIMQRIWDTLLDEASAAYYLRSECYYCRDKRDEEHRNTEGK
jgi:hypothetical protein